MRRRDFLRTATAVSAAPVIAATVSPSAFAAAPPEPLLRFDPAGETVRDGMRFRQLGRTGVEVSCVGLGGFHIGKPETDDEAVKIVRTALDGGINFLDNCWDYNSGLSELRMGKALQDGYRRKAFLMTKIDGRTRAEAARQIDQSLLRMRTDVLDLVQHHEMIRLEDADRVFGEGGAQEAVEAAKKAGKLRFVGFTGHKDPLVHLRTLQVARDHGFRFDAVQMPLNVMDAHFRSFARGVLPELVKDRVGVLGMKALADGMILDSKTATPVECLRYALTLPTSVVITGCETPERVAQALAVAREFKPLTVAEVDALLARTAKAAAKGDYEKFKTGVQFDGTAKHPEWMG